MKITLQNRKLFNIQGNLLAAALVIGVVLGTTLAAYLTLTGDATNRTIRSMVYNSTIPILEAGLEEALSQIHAHGLSTNWSDNGWTLTNNIYMKKRVVGDGYYVVGISNTVPPVVFSRGYAKVPISDVEVARTVVLQTKQDALFAKGMVAKGEIDLKGNNIKSDSFDSSDPLFSTLGNYDPTKTKDNGDIATNSGLINSLSVGNANVFGKVSTGPGGSISIGPGGAVGSAVWQAANSGIQPGWSSDDMNVSFPDVEIPTGLTSAPLATSGNHGGTNYAYVLDTGDYRLNSLSLVGSSTQKSTLLVNGNARLYVEYGFGMSGHDSIIVNTNSSLQLYVNASNASLGGNGVVNYSGNATNFYYFGTTNNTSLSFNGNGTFTGVIYAPNAMFSLNGSGSSSSDDFIGSSITEEVQMTGNFNFHYDENLMINGPSRGFVITSWEEIHVSEPDWQTYFPL